MSGPIDTAYLAFQAVIAGALGATGFLTDGSRLEVDPEDTTEIDGEAADLEGAAILLKLATGHEPGRTRIGTGVARYLVTREIRLELALAGPKKDSRDQVFAAALAAIAPLPDTDPTLGGTVERWGITGSQDGDLPPNGRKLALEFYLRVRSGDSLGLTP